MSDQDTTPKLTPTQRLHEVTIAALTKQPAPRVESVTFKQATVGDLKGTWVCDGATIVRTEDETDTDAYLARCAFVLHELDKVLIEHNATRFEREAEVTLEKAKR